MRGEDGSYIDDVDEKLAEIENAAAAPYRKLLRDEIPRGQDRADFAMFIATSFSRSPALIRSHAEAYARSAQLRMRMYAENRERFDQLVDKMEHDTGQRIEQRDEVFAFINDPERYGLEVTEKRGLVAIGVADELAPLFYERHWYVVDAVGETFITSDNPVQRWVPRDSIHPILGDGGFKNERAEVSYPLSPSRLLVISGQRFDRTRIQAGPQQVWNFNRMRAANAEDLLFADRLDERLSALIHEFRDERPRMSIDHPYARDVEIKLIR